MSGTTANAFPCLAGVLGRTVVKKSLLTRELGVARDLALRWWRAYDELHINVGRLGMAGKTRAVQSLIERLKREGRHYRLIHKPDGTIEVDLLGPEATRWPWTPWPAPAT